MQHAEEGQSVICQSEEMNSNCIIVSSAVDIHIYKHAM